MSRVRRHRSAATYAKATIVMLAVLAVAVGLFFLIRPLIPARTGAFTWPHPHRGPCLPMAPSARLWPADGAIGLKPAGPLARRLSQ